MSEKNTSLPTLPETSSRSDSPRCVPDNASMDFIKEDEVPQGWGLYHYKNNKFYKIKDSIQFVPKWENFTEGLDSEKAKEVSTIYRYATAILVNNILCKKTNVVFSKRVLEYRNKL